LLNEFSSAVDYCLCFMNDGQDPVLVFEQEGETRIILNLNYYQLIQKEAEL